MGMQQESKTRAGRQGGTKRRKTRELILQTARELFNERGEANVTLAHIGEQLGISEGNVWYHFHTKRELILALFSELQEQIKANQAYDLDELVGLDNLGQPLTRGFQLIWEYRFLLRDHANWGAAEPSVHEQLVELTVRANNFIRSVLERLLELRVIEIEDRDIPVLATNIWIVNRYWVDYCLSRSEQQRITEQDIQEGIRQVVALVRPYLTSTVLDMLKLAPNQSD